MHFSEFIILLIKCCKFTGVHLLFSLAGDALHFNMIGIFEKIIMIINYPRKDRTLYYR